MHLPGRSVSLAVLLVAACYNPSEAPGTDTNATTSGGGDGGGSSGTLGMTSAPGDDDGDDDATGVDPSTSSMTAAVDDSSSDGGATTTSESGSEESSESGSPSVCGDGTMEGDEQCDDGNEADGDFCAADCTIETRVFSYTGGSQSFTVPAWVTTITVEAQGAQGGHSMCCLDDGTEAIDEDGGRGGTAIGTIGVTPGTEVYVLVGGQGVTEGAGGWNGGGFGGEWGAGGGGASDVRIGGEALTDRVLVAGGGGGGNCGCPDHGSGGPGGGLSGGAGISLMGLLAPGGGTPTMGGTAGDPPGTDGGLGIGGGPAMEYHLAGGGGGWYGGGSAYAAGGGGGSSYLGVAIGASTQADMREGDGEVRITPVVP